MNCVCFIHNLSFESLWIFLALCIVLNKERGIELRYGFFWIFLFRKLRTKFKNQMEKMQIQQMFSARLIWFSGYSMVANFKIRLFTTMPQTELKLQPFGLIRQVLSAQASDRYWIWWQTTRRTTIEYTDGMLAQHSFPLSIQCFEFAPRFLILSIFVLESCMPLTLKLDEIRAWNAQQDQVINLHFAKCLLPAFRCYCHCKWLSNRFISKPKWKVQSFVVFKTKLSQWGPI